MHNDTRYQPNDHLEYIHHIAIGMAMYFCISVRLVWKIFFVSSYLVYVFCNEHIFAWAIGNTLVGYCVNIPQYCFNILTQSSSFIDIQYFVILTTDIWCTKSFHNIWFFLSRRGIFYDLSHILCLMKMFAIYKCLFLSPPERNNVLFRHEFPCRPVTWYWAQIMFVYINGILLPKWNIVATGTPCENFTLSYIMAYTLCGSAE